MEIVSRAPTKRTVLKMEDRAPMTHELKIQPEHFLAVIEGNKRAEIRKMDRDFRVGDLLKLREWDPRMKQTSDGVPATAELTFYTGRSTEAAITHILTGWGLQDGYAMLSFGKVY